MTKVEVLKVILRCSQGNLNHCKSCLQTRMLIVLVFLIRRFCDKKISSVSEIIFSHNFKLADL